MEKTVKFPCLHLKGKESMWVELVLGLRFPCNGKHKREAPTAVTILPKNKVCNSICLFLHQTPVL